MKNPIKIIIEIIICLLILVACSKTQTDNQPPTETEPEITTKYKVTINFEKDEVTEQDDLILLADDKGNIYHGFRSSQKNVYTTIPTSDIYLLGDELEIKEKFPKINENEEYLITINYETKEYSIVTVPKKEE